MSLVELSRVRTKQETQLVRREFDAAESNLFLLVMARRLAELRDALSGPIDVVGQVPTDVDVTAA